MVTHILSSVKLHTLHASLLYLNYTSAKLSNTHTLQTHNLKRVKLWRLYYFKSEVKSLGHAQLFGTPWIPAPSSSVHGIFKARSTGVGCHFLLQGIFPTQGPKPGLSHCRQTLYRLSHAISSIYFYWKWKWKGRVRLCDPWTIVNFYSLEQVLGILLSWGGGLKNNILNMYWNVSVCKQIKRRRIN